MNAVGLLKKMAPMPTVIVAEAMANLGTDGYNGVRRITGQEIRPTAEHK